MNKQVADILKKCQFTSASANGYVIHTDLEKFANELLKEAANVIDELGNDIENGDMFRAEEHKHLARQINRGHVGAIAFSASDIIKQHFGVKA